MYCIVSCNFVVALIKSTKKVDLDVDRQGHYTNACDINLSRLVRLTQIDNKRCHIYYIRLV